MTPTPSAAPTPTLTPDPTAAPTATSGDFEYTVVSGDTFWDIAVRFDIAVDDLASTNELPLDTVLYVGQVLLIVGSTASLADDPTPEPIEIDNPAGTGWLIPVAGACIPTDDNQMPNAAREYRAGVHEGVDFFTDFACVDVLLGTPALASKAGRVIRVDHIYEPLTQSTLDELLAKVVAQGITDTGSLDRFRGRQVWIDHGDGFITRYSHLDSVPEDLLAGATVAQGAVVGFIGDSGTLESVSSPGVENHLHFELRIDTTFLGQGDPPDVVRALYTDVFFGE